MSKPTNSHRFIFKTTGVCPPEIHFQIEKDFLTEIRFVGGGCPGNAHLVARLLRGRPIAEILPILNGIDCRNGTSCPDQLATAITQAGDGQLAPADSFRLFVDSLTRHRVGIAGELAGNSEALKSIAEDMSAIDTEVVYCIGNLTGSPNGNDIKPLKKLIRKFNILAIQGEEDWKLAGLSNERKIRDWLIQLPQVLTFQLGAKKGIAFYGDYISKLPGFSDYEPFALEMNMVCGLTDFMQDDTVFPALEAMIPQFQADIIIFSQNNHWGHWHVGGKDFVSIGPVVESKNLSWGLLEIVNEKVTLEVKSCNLPKFNIL
jgi:uncharacterized protein (TIGR03905 family)